MKYLTGLYAVLCAVMLIAIISMLYIEPTRTALSTASTGKQFFYISAGITVLFSLIISMVFSSYRYFIVGVLPPIATFIMIQPESNSLYVPLVFIIALGITSFTFSRQLSGQYDILIFAASTLVLGIMIAIFSAQIHFHNNRTGADNPYTQICIDAGYKGAKGDSCVND